MILACEKIFGVKVKIFLSNKLREATPAHIERPIFLNFGWVSTSMNSLHAL